MGLLSEYADYIKIGIASGVVCGIVCGNMGHIAGVESGKETYRPRKVYMTKNRGDKECCLVLSSDFTTPMERDIGDPYAPFRIAADVLREQASELEE